MSFKVTAQPSNLSFSANADETILEAALNANMVIQYGCQSGACGACKCKVISGEAVIEEPFLPSLSEEEKSQGIVLACRAKIKSDLVIEAAITANERVLTVKTQPAEVSLMNRYNDDTMIVQLQLDRGASLDFSPGQYINFLLPDAAPRSYSMASLPSATSAMGKQIIELHIRHMNAGKFTTHVFEEMKVGDQWQIKGPLGTFYLREESQKPIIFITSGTGFAPVKGIIEHMQREGIDRKTTLYWGGRRQKDLYMFDWVKKQMEVMPNLSFIPVISDALDEDNWQGRTGFVHEAVMQDYPDLSAHQVYACGTPVMVESAHKVFLDECALPKDEFFMDSFTDATDA